jgi:hypothetical protein
MSNYNNHTRFFYTNYADIQSNINLGKIDQWDIIISSDTQEMILITENYELVPIKSKVYRFADIDSAEDFLNNSTDTYEGQIVSILSSSGNYQAYIVNKDATKHYVVKSISVYEPGDINYSDLGERPIDNLTGDIENPVILSNQPEGIYKVYGAYKLSESYLTIFQSSNSKLYFISKDEANNTLIKIVSTSEIIDYVVSPDGEILEKSVVPTTAWLEEQGYVTEDYVDYKLETLNVLTKEEAQSYIKELMDVYASEIIDAELDKKIDEKLEEKLVAESQQSIYALFS